MTAVAGASLLALMGLFDVVGTTLSGWLTDRVDPRHLLAWYYALRGLAVIALPLAFGSGYALIAFAVFYGLDWVATVPPTVALTVESFGANRVGIVFGWYLCVAPVRRRDCGVGRRRFTRLVRDVQLRVRQPRGALPPGGGVVLANRQARATARDETQCRTVASLESAPSRP
jgi:hypothetical protein